ncbi:MAG: hypothetical protein D3909_03735, partial [Candidatus Electrothrix sp. ATG1]|nr:hypothetical protein [Candidatus Electrothrix sp. ATG1]
MTKNGLYIGDPWEKFLAQRDRLPNWKISLNLAVILHLAVFTGAAVMPDVGKKTEPDNVITIDLLSLPSVAPAPVAVQEVAPRSTPQHRLAPQQPKAAQEKVVQKKEQEQHVEQVEQVEQVERVIEPSTPKVAVSPPALPVVVPKGISKSEPR